MKRWMAGAVTVLAAVGGLAAAGPAGASSHGWYQTYQVNRSGTFLDIAAIGKTNIWAVGLVSGKNGSTSYQPFIRHYAGGGWETVTIPGSPRFESNVVSASAANNVWVFGLSPRSAASTVAYRYDGSHWHKIRVPAQTDLFGAVVLGPRNVWAYGSTATIQVPGSRAYATVFHWNGSRWRGYNVAGGKAVWGSISASAAKNVWLAGAVPASTERTVAYRWNGTRWHEVGIPRLQADRPKVAAFSRSNVWIGWYTQTSSGVTHWDGHHWHTTTIPGDVNTNVLNIVPDGKGGYWFGAFAILTGKTWSSEPAMGVSAGLGAVVRIPGTESFLDPAGVESSNSTIQKPTIFRFDL
jgi:hypothetical protein